MALCAGDSVEPLVPSGWLRASKAAFVCQEVPFFMSSPTGYDGETQETSMPHESHTRMCPLGAN